MISVTLYTLMMVSFDHAARTGPLPPACHTGARFGYRCGQLIAGRVHVDIRTDDLPAEVARLEKLGAERVQQVHSWQVMRDPAGLLFCVLPEPPGALDDSNAQRWD
jgi:hypothetical protein